MKKQLLVISTLIFLTASCTGLPGISEDQLEGTSWSLVSYSGNTLIPDTEMTAIFADGQINGSASCNHYFASYQVRGVSLEIEGLGWTEMACLNPEGVMDQELEIMRLLGSASSYQIQDNQLIIRTDSGQQLIFGKSQNETK